MDVSLSFAESDISRLLGSWWGGAWWKCPGNFLRAPDAPPQKSERNKLHFLKNYEKVYKRNSQFRKMFRLNWEKIQFRNKNKKYIQLRKLEEECALILAKIWSLKIFNLNLLF